MKEDPIAISLAWSRDVKYYKSLKASSAEQKKRKEKRAESPNTFELRAPYRLPPLLACQCFFVQELDSEVAV